jgi:preprotein translocase subunit SecF
MKVREAVSTFRGHRVPNFNIIGRRWRWFGLSGLFIILSLVGMFARGLNFSIDFKGGSVLSLPDRSGASVDQFRAVMSNFGLPDATVEQVSGGDCPTGCVNIRTKSLTVLGLFTQPSSSVTPTASATPSPTASPSATPSASPSATPTPSPSASSSASPTPSATPTSQGIPTQRGDQLRASLASTAGISVNDINEDDVGPTWGSTITRKAVVGLIIFLILVTIYISFRFELKMAAGALVALAHDLIITAGIYALVGREVTPETVIAILTILGYSLYDTVVIFDKVKENTEQASLVARDGYSGVVNMSLNQTLMRSVNTSLVVLLPIGGLLLFGGSTLKDFAFALFVGVASGTYSSIFIAAPTLALAKEREPRYQELRRRAEARASRPGLRTGPVRGPLARAEPDGEQVRPKPPASTAAASGSTAGSSRPRPAPGSGAARKKKGGRPQGKPKRKRR